MKKMLFIPAALAAVSAAATPNVTDVHVSQNDSTLEVTVTYKVDEPAVVTLDILADGKSIGPAALRKVTGEVNKLVTNLNQSCSIVWHPDEDWTTGARKTQNVSAKVSAWSTNCPPTFMAVNIFDPEVVRYYVHRDALPYDITNDVYKTDWLLFRKIPAAGIPWRMGAPADEASYYKQNAVQETPHIVTLTEDYYFGVFPVTTYQQYRLCCDAVYNLLSPATGTGVYYDTLRGTSTDEGPINWPETGHKVSPTSVLGVFRSKLGIDVDLPTEAQWEYACRAGTGTALYDGTNYEYEHAVVMGWNTDLFDKLGMARAAQPVGQLLPNNWDIYDLYGNVWEWCLDWMSSDVTANDLSKLPCIDPKGLESGTYRVNRGGGWNSGPLGRSAFRITGYTGSVGAAAAQGFRLAAPAIAPFRAK